MTLIGIEHWPRAWLEAAVEKTIPGYRGAPDWVKLGCGWPITDAELRRFVQIAIVVEDVQREVFGEKPANA